jgi:predicted metalloprotease with PDZ domain
MVQYTFSCENPSQQYISIQAIFSVTLDQTLVHLPSWRPGRYELGNFAKNVKSLKVFDQDRKVLTHHKISKDTWVVDTRGKTKISVDYQYYAAELNAGSTFLNEEQLYVNPINCCLFTDETMHEPIAVQLRIPAHWTTACSMSKEGEKLLAENFDELADSPFICSASLQYNQYESQGTVFHLWFNGEIKPDWSRLINDFKAFTAAQIGKFMEFPVPEYHFIIQVLPYKAYHGVEHKRSTVIALGPLYDVFGGLYNELLGVSSHELYHTWNVKSIRPIEMFPYRYKQENYSPLGYLYEGVTTYMGDLFLFKSGVFSLQQYLLELTKQVQKHFDNHGRFNYSVAESSFDTWLDGYVVGAPARKVSIYTEGCLLAFVTDVMILKATEGQLGLDTVMKRLYFDYCLKGKGVSGKDYKSVLENVSGISFDSFFEDFVHGNRPYESILTDALDFIGLELHHNPSADYSQGRLGFKAVSNGAHFTIKAIYPGSPAYLGGLQLEDEVIAVNGFVCQGELDKWLKHFDEDLKHLTVLRAGQLLQKTLPEVDRNFYMEYSIVPLKKRNSPQIKAFDSWSK